MCSTWSFQLTDDWGFPFDRFIVRDFKYDEDALKQQQDELNQVSSVEVEQQAELVRLARINFGELFASWVHLKALRVFVESVLRYGLPPDFTSVTIAAQPKFEKKVDETLLAQYGRLGGIHGLTSKSSSSQQQHDEILDHDLQSVNDSSYRPYVQFDLHFEVERTWMHRCLSTHYFILCSLVSLLHLLC